MIIAITGKKGSGKDTLADIIVNEYDFIKYSFGDDIKLISKILFNFNNEQLYGNKKDIIDDNWHITPREFFQKFGTDYIQNIFPKTFPNIFNKGNIDNKEFWLKKFELWYLNEKRNKKIFFVVISDLRFIHEYNYIKKLGGYIIKIERDNLNDNINTEHISENELDNFTNDKFNYVIKNNGSINDLENIIKKIM